MKNMQIAESGNNEWYTPEKYIISARNVMGDIDIDPASNDISQKYIQANRYYREKDDGLLYEWKGNIWLNPPYSRKLMLKFIEKLICSVNISSYICITNASTDTSWCHLLMNDADSMCITRGRINFLNDQGFKSKSNSRGQIFFYKGINTIQFENEFSQYGKVIHLKKRIEDTVVDKGLFDE